MKKIIYFGILLFSFLLLTTKLVVAQQIAYMTLIDSKEMKYIDNVEISIKEWQEYEADIKNKYGDKSTEFIATLPDTAMFKKYYNYSYISSNSVNTKSIYSKEDIYFMLNNYAKYPIIGISYQQCIDYCNWRTEVHILNSKNKNKIVFSLPDKEDYKIAATYAKKTFNPPLSILVKSKTGKIRGLTDNVDEYVKSNLVYKDKAIGFRCVALVTNCD